MNLRSSLIQLEFSFGLYASAVMAWNKFGCRSRRRFCFLSRWGILLLLQAAALAAYGQTPDSAPAAPAGTNAPVEITLNEAIRLAEKNEPGYAAAKANSQSAALDRSIARASLLPSARLLNQDIYVQFNGVPSQDGEGVSADYPRFVSYDARPWEYIAQGVAEESLSVGAFAGVQRANAAAAMARAEQEIARRGLVATVVGLFYSSIAADRKLAVAVQALDEAAAFTKLTNQLEQKREAAHADVVKAELTEQQRNRDLENARVVAEKARLDLGVLLFADPRTGYTLKAPAKAAALESKEAVEQAAAENNPELKGALAVVAVSRADVKAAWGAMLPSALFSVNYGIDANQFAANGPLVDPTTGIRARNLGYSTSVTVNLPVWDWLSNQHKVKQSEIRHEAAKVALSATQRRLIAQLEEAYSEARVARDQLTSLDVSVAAAAESLRLTKLRYENGEAMALEVMDAENTYVTAENAREDGRVRYEAARAALQTLTGTM
jgi:outer membrane protein TolC